MSQSDLSTSLGQYETAVDDALNQLRQNRIVQRIWNHDHTVWKEDPEEITNRLGWLQTPQEMKDSVLEIKSFVSEVLSAGFTQALLLGMGGSSLAPLMFRRTFGVSEGYLDLQVLDSTDPGALLEQRNRLDPSKTLFIVSTKSGTTIETLSFLKYFYNEALEEVGKDEVGNHFVAITDPGSSLAPLAESLGFRRAFLNNPDIGGRYSALSYFGLIPAALIGVDIDSILDQGSDMARRCKNPWQQNPGARLGAVMGKLASSGRDKLTIVTPPSIFHLGLWIEQLIAESTGKEGNGILPVVGEEILSSEYYSKDRLFVYLRSEDDDSYDKKIKMLNDSGHPLVRIDLSDLYDIGGEFFRWEMATCVAASILGVNPFDQPNVESAKKQARSMMDSYREKGKLPKPEPIFRQKGVEVYSEFGADCIRDALSKFLTVLENAPGKKYVALQAYLTPSSETDQALHSLRTLIQKKYRVATTVGYGPRFLHSTGQLHKGDSGNGLFIQITYEAEEDVPIPDRAGEKESSMTFGVLMKAQALGDAKALTDSGRDVIRFHLGKDVLGGLQKLTEVIA